MTTPVIAVDVMSSESGCVPTAVAAAHRASQKFSEIKYILVGDAAEIKKSLRGVSPCGGESFEVIDAPEVVAMDELPARAMRRRNTSMRRALDLVAAKEANAAVSAGNTGALMGTAALTLKLIDGIARPAIGGFVPNKNATDFCCMLDLGANVECSAEMLYDFAVMGSAFVTSVKELERPRVGLLNVGAEYFKGTKIIQEAAELIKQNSDLNFIGNVEGYDIFRGGADVVVCDGFTGNVALKVTEGLAQMISGMVKSAFVESPFAKACGIAAMPVLRKLRRRLDHRPYNGACFLGLNGVVVKSHGNADVVGFAAAIEYAALAAEHDLTEHIHDSAHLVKTGERMTI